MYITASILYNYLQCPHRVWRDLHGPQDEKDPEPNPFVEMLWDRGVQHEEKVIAEIGEYLDLSEGAMSERAVRTMEAMRSGTNLIYQGVIRHGDILGIPDLLRKHPVSGYIPVDIKSGMGLEGEDADEGDEGKMKKHYAVQLCLYREALEGVGMAADGPRCGIILDGHRQENIYTLESPQGPRTPETYWALYERLKNNVRIIAANEEANKPAIAGSCKLCPWYMSCKRWCVENDDPTTLFYLGRSKRDTLELDMGIKTVDEVAQLDVDEIMEKKAKDKGFLKGVGEKTVQKWVLRAKMMKSDSGPVAYEQITLPEVSFELFFDIEDDPTQEFVYMHGVYERSPKGERYLDFTATELTDSAEKEAWSNFWKYVRGLPQDDYAVYYYSPHEKTTYKKMQKKYPDVISEEEVERFFSSDHVIDLYTNVVLKKTDWPLTSYSIKAIATYLGFSWRDKTPSGALSIQWFNEYLNDRNPDTIKRILEYNEDDCKATMVLKDGLLKLNTNCKPNSTN